MAFYCVRRNVFLILPLLVILTITTLSSSFSPSDKVTKELLYQLCAKPTIDNQFCISWLTSDPTTLTLDLSGLVGLVLQKTQVFGNMNLAAMKGLARTTIDPTLKTTYEICVKDYELAVTEIERAQVFASSKSYELVPLAVSKAWDRISSCEAGLQGLKNMKAYANRKMFFEKMCNICSVFEKMCNIGSVFSNVLKS